MLHFKVLATLALLFLVLPCWGQVNVKVGYNIGYTNPSDYNHIYQIYNEQRPWLTQPLKEMRSINGLQLGLRYRFDYNLALEVNWQNQYHRQTAIGVIPADGSNFNQSFSFRCNSLGLGLEYFVGSVSWGASYNFDQIRYKTVATKVEKFILLQDTGWSSHFFIAYNLKGNNFFHLSIRPYAQISWQAFNLNSIFQEVTGISVSGAEEGYNALGIMLVFYNGYE